MQFARSGFSRGAIGLVSVAIGSLTIACAGEHLSIGVDAGNSTVDLPSSGGGGAIAETDGPPVSGTGGTASPTPGSGGATDTGATASGGAGTGGTGGAAATIDAGPGPDAARPDAGFLLPAPAATWQEHWFEHNQLLDLVAFNDDVAIYFDKDVPRAGTEWILPAMTQGWQYTRQTYGDFKTRSTDGRFYSIFHQGRYNGCHPGFFTDTSHDSRNASDCGPGPWTAPDIADPGHQMAYVVEYTNNGISGSPGASLWGVFRFAEFFKYDLFVALGRTAEATAAQTAYMANVDTNPRDGTYWFRDWFYPLWRDHGHAQVMVKFFKLLSQYFPRSQGKYSRANLTYGELVHFMSGAAGSNLKAQAVTAFGPNFPTDAEFAKARADFPQLVY